MWYVLSDGSGNEKTYGFESEKREMFGEGNVTEYDNAAYKQTSHEVSISPLFRWPNSVDHFTASEPTITLMPVTTDPGTITIKDTFKNFVFGDESKSINVEASGTKVVAGNGDNKVDVTGRLREITLGHGSNLITGNIRGISVGNGNNIIKDTADFTKIKLGDGNNHVLISGLKPTLEVGHGINNVEFKGRSGSLIFTKDISPEQLWFQHKEQDLNISVIGSKQKVTLHNWYADLPERPREIITGSNRWLMERNVERLVEAMAAFAPPTSATFNLSETEQQRLQPVLAANWR